MKVRRGLPGGQYKPITERDILKIHEKIKTVKEWIRDFPDDYELCLSKYMALVQPENPEDGEHMVVIDDPVIGMAKNDESKEIRLIVQTSEEEAIKQIENGNWGYFDDEHEYTN